MEDKLARTRSRQTNHRALLPGLDGRSAGARRFRDLVGQISTDLGGIDTLAESKLQLCKRFAAACVLSEEMESRLARGIEIDISEHAQLCSTLVRIANHIGIDRVPRPINDDDAPGDFGFTESVVYGHLDEHGKLVIDGDKDPLA